MQWKDFNFPLDSSYLHHFKKDICPIYLCRQVLYFRATNVAHHARNSTFHRILAHLIHLPLQNERLSKVRDALCNALLERALMRASTILLRTTLAFAEVSSTMEATYPLLNQRSPFQGASCVACKLAIVGRRPSLLPDYSTIEIINTVAIDTIVMTISLLLY